MIHLTNLHIALKSGIMLKFTHVTRMEIYEDKNIPVLLVDGEHLDAFKMGRLCFDRIPLSEILSFYGVPRHEKA